MILFDKDVVDHKGEPKTGEVRAHQVKSKWYYIFWGVATVVVLSGQVFVGLGYREMANQQHELTDTVQKLLTK